MGLDIYVGSLTRYYSGLWESAVQKAAREGGHRMETIYATGPPDRPTPDDAKAAILAWRVGLSASLHKHIGRELDWREDLEAPYFTEKPAWDCYGAILLWAAHDEQPLSELPRTERDWFQDPALKAVQAAAARSRYSSLTSNVEFWLPGDEPLTFRAPDPVGNEVGFAFIGALVRELAELNARTWKAGAADLVKWRHEGADIDAPTETSARFAFAVMEHLANEASDNRLPMKLDY